MMDGWVNAAPSLRAAAALSYGTNGGDLSISNGSAGVLDANSPLFAAQQRQLAFEQAARLALPKPSIPSYSLGNYGGLLAAAAPPGISTTSNLQMLRDALLFQDAVNGKRGASGRFGLEHLHHHQQQLPKINLPSGPSLFTQVLRGKKHAIKTAMEGPLKKKLKTDASSAVKQQQESSTVWVKNPSEIKSSFPLPSTTEKKHHKKKKIVLKEMQAKWDRLECESDAVEHDTDAAQEALVKECFLRSLHRYNLEHLRQRIHKQQHHHHHHQKESKHDHRHHNASSPV